MVAAAADIPAARALAIVFKRIATTVHLGFAADESVMWNF